MSTRNHLDGVARGGKGRADTAASAPESRWLREALGLSGCDTPFPWQTRLLKRFCGGVIDRSLDIPTGLGKTSVMAIWLVARGTGASLPRRLVYVVDRRAVVDQASEVALQLREYIESNTELKEALGLRDRALPISTLRGKLADNREWMDDPASPAIVVGTVDMIGSRLLFQGYRASRKIRPYLAGLLGHDTIFVLDEAHLVPPFERLMERIGAEQSDLRPSAGLLATLPPSRILSLSATGRSRSESNDGSNVGSDCGPTFGLDDDDQGHPIVAKRLRASKRLTVESLPSLEGLAKVAAERAWTHVRPLEQPVRYLLFFNRRTDAEDAMKELRELAGLTGRRRKGEEPRAEVELLVGGRRLHERQEAQAWLAHRGFLSGSQGSPARHTFLFATSAGEVGIDLDADHMVGDRVPWERTVQRLGRVNRRGEGDARVLILDAPLGVNAEEDEHLRREAVLELLKTLPQHPDGGVDASPGALDGMQRDVALRPKIAAASTPDPMYPRLERATLDDWSMTSLPPHAGRTSIAPWLRGWIKDDPRTTVSWRTWLPVGLSAAQFNRYFEAAPVHLSELLETETRRVVKWLRSRTNKLMKKAAKAIGGDEELLLASTVVAVTRVSRSEAWKLWTLQELSETKQKALERSLRRAELVLDARFGGLAASGLLDNSVDKRSVTADGEGDRSFAEQAGLPFRVSEALHADANEAQREAGLGREWFERARFAIHWTKEGVADRWLVIHKRTIDAATEDDRSSGPPQPLDEHQASAKRHAEKLASRLGLSDEARQVLAIAARLHDEGKRAASWQWAFNAKDTKPMAKTRGPVNAHLLDGYRHEFGSLPYAEQDPEVQALSPEHRDLVLHMIASHHGFARPVVRTSGCDDAPPSVLERRAREVARRFFRLQERWGPWGLAWWESLLRAADQQASRENQEKEHDQNDEEDRIENVEEEAS